MFYTVKPATSLSQRGRTTRTRYPPHLGDSPTQIRRGLPMLGLEESCTMRIATRRTARIGRPGEGEWVLRLMADINREIASQPHPEAIKRIRDRLLDAIKPPAEAAA